jgi:hypothetical protein
MATLSTGRLTLMERAKRSDPNGKTAKIAEILSQSNEILDDMVFKEGNLPTGEQCTIRTGLPTAYYRLTNNGTPTSKSTTAQITENAALLEARSHVDVDIASLEDDLKGFRVSESMAFMEAMSQKMAETVIYGDSSSPEEFVGLSSRYNDLSATNAENILDAGGTSTDNTSIYLVGWSDQTVYGIYPKGSKAGLTHQDLGEDDVDDASGNPFRAYKDLYKWKNGLVVKDWRYVVRVANVDISDLVGLTGTQAVTAATAIIKQMDIAISHLPNLNNVNLAFYGNRTVLTYLRQMALDKSSSAVTIEQAQNQFGKTIHETRFQGIPVRKVDQLLNTEARVVSGEYYVY